MSINEEVQTESEEEVVNFDDELRTAKWGMAVCVTTALVIGVVFITLLVTVLSMAMLNRIEEMQNPYLVFVSGLAASGFIGGFFYYRATHHELLVKMQLNRSSL